jgi:predicted DCC family thiol-disulfide oxidoreductase YuxK
VALSGIAVKPSWNPFRCGGTEYPVNVLLTAKLIAFSLLITNHVRLLPDPFLPFVPGLDQIAPPAVFQRVLQVVFFLAALALMFNRRPRIASLVLGGSILLAVVSSKAYYGNNKTFAGLILFLTGLYEPGGPPWVLRAQFALVYFGAGLNKLLDPDWRSGLFMDHWAGVRLKNSVYLAARAWLPPMLLAQAMCWGTIVAELGASAAFLVRRWYPAGILVSLLFQSSLLLFTGDTFSMFFYGMQAALLIFVDWPTSPWLVIYDGDCGFCNRCKRWFERLDLEGLLDWRPFQSGAGKAFGISDAAASEQVYLVAGKKVYSGFRAIRRMLLFNPLTYFAIAFLIGAPRGDFAYLTIYRRVVVALLLAVLLPPFLPIGERLYRLVARNRYKLAPGGNCAVERTRH